MDILATIDPGLAGVIGAVSTLIATLGTVWVKNRIAKSKAATSNVDNTVRLTETMTSVIDLLEKELDTTSKRIEECRTAIAERDDVILELRKQLHDAIAESHRLKAQVMELRASVLNLKAKVARLQEDTNGQV